MKKKIYLMGIIFLFCSIGNVFGQERAPQHSGFGTGVGDSQGSGTRARVMDEGDMLRYLSAPETVMGEVLAVVPSADWLYVDIGNSSTIHVLLPRDANLSTFLKGDSICLKKVGPNKYELCDKNSDGERVTFNRAAFQGGTKTDRCKTTVCISANVSTANSNPTHQVTPDNPDVSTPSSNPSKYQLPIMGEIVSIDHQPGRLHIGMGGSSRDERQQIRGGMNMRTLYFDDKTNLVNLNAINKGDYVSIQAVQETDATHKFSTGRAMVREVYVLEGNQLLGGEDNPDFGGGLGQRPDPRNYRGISTETAGYTGVPEGGIQEGDVKSGITSSMGATTGAAPCWQCAPQPDNINKGNQKFLGADYGISRDNFNKGTVQ